MGQEALALGLHGSLISDHTVRDSVVDGGLNRQRSTKTKERNNHVSNMHDEEVTNIQHINNSPFSKMKSLGFFFFLCV